MDKIKISAAQFENRRGYKAYNLSIIERLARKAAKEGSDVIAFHECSITGYTFAKNLSIEQLIDQAEYVPGGDSVLKLIEIARQHEIVLLAGLFEKDEKDQVYNTYVCVDKNGLVSKYRKLHPFIHPNLKAGDDYCVFEIHGWKCGVLICYDNNINQLELSLYSDFENFTAFKPLTNFLIMPANERCRVCTISAHRKLIILADK